MWIYFWIFHLCQYSVVFLFSYHGCLIDRILLCCQDEPRTHAASTSLQAELQVHITTTVLINIY